MHSEVSPAIVFVYLPAVSSTIYCTNEKNTTSFGSSRDNITHIPEDYFTGCQVLYKVQLSPFCTHDNVKYTGFT